MVLLLFDVGQVRPWAPPPHGPADVSPRPPELSPAYPAEAMIGLPVTVLPMRRMYVPALGLAASVMPPD